MRYLLTGLFIFFLTIIFTLKHLEKKATSQRIQPAYAKTYQFMNTTMSYKIVGKGKKIVLLHGSMLGNPWSGFENELAKYYQVYLPQLPGFGASDALDGEIHNTDLFTSVFCEFLKKENLKNTPVISLSLGTIVSVKAAARGCSRGKLVLVGCPNEVSGFFAFLSQIIPRVLKRIIIASSFGQKYLLAPALLENTGGDQGQDISNFLEALKETDVRTIVDVNYQKEIEVDLPKYLSKIENEKVFVYGELDQQIQKAHLLTKEYITVSGAQHNIFVTKPKESLTTIREILD